MDLIYDGLVKAFELVTTLDTELFIVVMTTLKVCLTAVAISTLIGLPVGILLGLKDFPGRRIILSIINVGMGIPPVVAGLWICVLFWRSGPLGNFEVLYTQKALILAQVVVSLPIVTGLVASTFQGIDQNFLLLIRSMGATRFQGWFLLIKQTRIGILAAIIAGLGRVFAEVGAAMMVGANVFHETQILTTSIVSEVGQGHFDVAFAISFVLLGITFSLTGFLTFLQKGGKRR
jgi:tungstate transport system permease protein